MRPSKLEYFWAGACALLFPGAGHLYADRAWTARLLCLGFAVCGLGLAFVGNEFVRNAIAGTTTFIVLCDLVGALFAIRRGPFLATRRQLRAGVTWLALSIVLGGFLARM
jgi:hypothetical protein